MKKIFFILAIFLFASFMSAHYFWLDVSSEQQIRLVFGHNFPQVENEKKIDGDLYFFNNNGVFIDKHRASDLKKCLIVFVSAPERLYLTDNGWKKELLPGETVLKERKIFYLAKQSGWEFSSTNIKNQLLKFDLIIETKGNEFRCFLLKRGLKINGNDLFLIFSGGKDKKFGKINKFGISLTIPKKEKILFYTKIEDEGEEFLISYLIF